MRDYQREWANLRNAVGFAADCARLALPLYDGRYRSDVIAALQIMERYANGGQIDCDDHTGPLVFGSTFAVFKHSAGCYDAAIRLVCARLPCANTARRSAAKTVRAAECAANCATRAAARKSAAQTVWAAKRAAERAADRGPHAAFLLADDTVTYFSQPEAELRSARLVLDDAKRAVRKARWVTRKAPGQAANRVASAANAAVDFGVDDHEIQAAFARWVVRDLNGERELPVELRQAAGAAIVGGNEALARELLT